MIRANVMETMNEDYVRTARAKGAPERTVMRSHVLRNALLPVVTMLGMDIGIALGGAIFTETVYGLPGLGRTAVQSLFNFDLPTTHGDHRLRDALHHRSSTSSSTCSTPSSTRGSGWPERPSMALLDVKDLKTYFRTDDGIVKAVDGVTFSVEKGKTLGIVGESGSRQERHLPDDHGPERQRSTTISSGEALFKGENLLGDEPQASARHPRQRDRDDLPGPDDVAEPGAHDRATSSSRRSSCTRTSTKAAARPARSSCSRRSASRAPSGGSTTTRTSSRAACASA